MIIGILSDTHDHADIAASAIRLLQERGAEYFIHCGDVGGEGVLDQLAGLPCAFVLGNTDWDPEGLARYADRIGINCHGRFADLTLDGKRIAVLHGDDTALRQRVILAQQHDYLLQGHTHIPMDQRQGKTRWINPGALHRAHPKTVATLDTGLDRLEWIEVAP